MPRLLPAVLLLALLTGACGDEGDPVADPVPGPTAAVPSDSPTADPTERPSPTRTPRPPHDPTPSARPSSPPDGAAGAPGRPLAPGRSPGAIPTSLATHLLGADAMPGPGAALGWTVRAEGAEGSTAAGCHKTPLVTIGALQAARREHTAGRDARSVQVVARFADRRSAWRAHRVLVAWHADCAERAARRVGPVRRLTVPTGVAEGYTTAGVRRDRTVTGLGILRTGPWLSVVELSAGPRTWGGGRAAESALDGAERATAQAVRRVARTF